MSSRDPGDVKYVIRPTSTPQEYIEKRQSIIDAEKCEFVRIHHGNIGERLQLHTGNYDVPSGRKSPDTDCGNTTPYELNLNDYKLMLDKNRPIFQFIYYDWKYRDTGQPIKDSNQATPDYEYVQERPNGWLDAKQVGYLKDQDQSAVTQAVYRGDLNVVMKESPKERFFRPDEKMTNWKSGRQNHFLLRRRLEKIKEIFQEEQAKPNVFCVNSVSELFDEVKRKEVRQHGDIHVGNQPYDVFIQRELSSSMPKSVDEWRDRIDDLIDEESR
jgi:hypothetical protein